MTIVTIIDNSNKDNPETSQHYRVTLKTCHLWDIWSEWWGDMPWPKKSTYPPTYLSTYLRAHPQDAILETCDLYDICSEWWGDLTWPKKALRCCDIWDTDYNTDNWEPEFMTFFVAWQLIVTLDSIRNSCDVLMFNCQYLILFAHSNFHFKLKSRITCRFRNSSYSPQREPHCGISLRIFKVCFQ